MIYRVSLGEKLSQGDIIRGVKVVVNVSDPENNLPKYDGSHIIVISRNCEIDKPIKISTGTNSVLVARVIRLSSAPQGAQGYLRANRVVNAFFLPGQVGFMEDCYIDWRTLQPVDKSNLYALRSQTQNYRCTLEKEVLEACLDSLFIFITKPDDEDNN